MALSEVMTRMPRVCMSIVASAFQYGCAPTLIPATTTFSSEPAWVNSMIRRRTAAIQSMFSVPLSMAMSAPADTANHSKGSRSSLGQVHGGDDPPALGLGQRAHAAAGIAEEDHPPHALGVAEP